MAKLTIFKMNHYKLKPSIIKLREGTSAPQSVQVLRVGNFSHPMSGDFDITPEVLRQMKKNFDERVRRIDLAIDYSHDSWAEAAGWFKEVELKNNDTELWVSVDWTDAGRKKVETKEFRYFSVEFHPDYEDDETKQKFGPTLLGAALTNRPFVKDMAPAVELNEQSGGKMELKELEQKIVKLTETVEALVKPKTVVLSDVEKENVQLKEDLKKAEKAKSDMEAAHESEKKLGEKRTLFNSLMKDGKVCKAQEKAYLDGNMEEFIKLAEKIDLKAAGNGNAPTEDDNISAQEKLITLAEKMVEEKKAKNLTEAQKMVIRENPDLYKKVQEELDK